MGAKFKEYLEESTKKIIEIVFSSDMEEEEKSLIVEVFSKELLNNIGNSSNLKDYEPLLYGVSVMYIDRKISAVLAKKNALYNDYESAIKLCQRQRKLLDIFQSRKWKIPKVNNVDIDKCLEDLQDKKEAIYIINKILEKDRQIDELIRNAKINLNVNICDELLYLITELDEDVAFCKSKKIRLPVINNKDINKIRKKITDLRMLAKKKEVLSQNIYNNDLRLHNLVSLQGTTQHQWQEIINLCQKQSDLLSNCSKNRWPLPSIRYNNPNEVADKYKHYLTMVELDRELLLKRDSLSTNEQYKNFFNNCNKQKNNIETCKRNRWEIPPLNINDPGNLINIVHAEKSKKDKGRRIRSRLLLVGVIVACILLPVFFCVYKYREGKIQIPFDSSYVTGKSLNDVYKELDEAGFKNITKKQDNSGWLDSGEVISVSIDNSYMYNKGNYRIPDVAIVITYSSDKRIYVTDLLEDWEKTDYETIQRIFKDAGFTNVIAKEIDTFEKDNDNLTASLSLNNKAYMNEYCYLPKDAPIIIYYYVLKLGIGNDSSQFIGQNCETVVENLKESGFINVQTQKVSTGWEKENTVVGVTVNNVDTYNSSDFFKPDVKIVVKYSSGDRIDVTSIFKNWQTKDYQQLQNSLNVKGFTNISVVEKVTNDSKKNHLVAGIILNNETFTAGDCYLQKKVSIKIEYYVLMITIGDTELSFEGEQYSDVVANLKKMGFTNIQLQRANDIGWWFFHADEGSIKTLSINGDRDFAETDSFRYDTPIIVVVHTKKGEGFKDITVIAD